MAVNRRLRWGVGGGVQSGETVENHDPQTERADTGDPLCRLMLGVGAGDCRTGGHRKETLDCRAIIPSPASRPAFCAPSLRPLPLRCRRRGVAVCPGEMADGGAGQREGEVDCLGSLRRGGGWGAKGGVRRVEGIERWNHLSFWYVNAERQLGTLVFSSFHPPGSRSPTSCYLYFCPSVCP